MKDKVINIIGYLIEQKRPEEVESIVDYHFPSGSGFDSGTKLLTCTEKQIILQMDYHHMDENGFYDGWSHHKVYIRPSFYWGFQIKVAGPNRNMIKDYILDTVCETLQKVICVNVKEGAMLKTTEDWV